ncbi:NAD(P)H-dependent oxidoreductase [Limosilactobacillus sp. STM2_1]|uniref:NAD(P)H-dependent oxidoreductase n=1 Tax=Limosilactobacillus rudii TaxID=2759755 RepID=A0A7W3UJG0_9LACO|nr:NAD(P)H-dependent oxidoreductase [Limosilactobacillus rudii]MBB1078494.1 NAD(P)H-dependent oxidoreductase [Limosilactobacillus rudii]MBB1096624.1 NAD(P)H-dependent oxidoreductase [Limosilactobacillus rudii]MCD7134181.1 NAD(P)H-dependent oxidoreductase [Limosilactobacillus rudii]
MTTTVLLFHPHLDQSRVNKALAGALDDDIEVRDMYKLYPDFKIDVATEQKVLTDSDRIVIQFPMYWYSSPALLKQWEDDVYEHGWAYGSDGDKLHGKELIIAVSPGANNYGRQGFAQYTIHELLRPFQATSRLIGTKFIKPFITIGASSITDDALQQRATEYNEYLHQDSLPILNDFE